MERTCHNSISGIKRFLDPIAVVAINIDIQYAGIGPQEFQYAEHDVIDVAEARSFTFFGMVQTACPVDRNVG